MHRRCTKLEKVSGHLHPLIAALFMKDLKGILNNFGMFFDVFQFTINQTITELYNEYWKTSQKRRLFMEFCCLQK
jgi:hypothetical protein